MFEFESKEKEYVTKTFRLPREMVEKLTRLASKSNISLNEAVRQSLEFALSQMGGEEDE